MVDKILLEAGIVGYHGTSAPRFDQFKTKTAVWFAEDEEFASKFAKGSRIFILKNRNKKNAPTPKGSLYITTVKLDKPINLRHIGIDEKMSARDMLRHGGMDDAMIERILRRSFALSDARKNLKGGWVSDETGHIYGSNDSIKDHNWSGKTEIFSWFDKQAFVRACVENGYDGVLAEENGHNTIGVFDTSKIEITSVKDV